MDVRIAEGMLKAMGRAIEPQLRTMEFVPGRDTAEARTMEFVPERDKAEVIQLEDGENVADGAYLRELLRFGEGGEPGRLFREQQEKRDDMNRATEYVAGNPSFDITGRSGDARRKRRDLTPGDVNRLMNAYPDDAEKIRKMYLPGPTLRGV